MLTSLVVLSRGPFLGAVFLAGGTVSDVDGGAVVQDAVEAGLQGVLRRGRFRAISCTLCCW